MMAMILCAGEGTRLRPLTYALPKPMIPVANMPVLEITLRNLKKHGIRKVVINLSYHADMIRSYFQDGSRWGMEILYSVEKKLWGTAGGVKKAERLFKSDPDPDFLVTSGDGLTDMDFTHLVRFHKNKKALGTIALKKVDSRFEYGVTLTNGQGKIKSFLEKPTWGSIFSDTVNTGIYVFNKKIFDTIPPGRFYDFGNHVWPLLLKRKLPVYGLTLREFWTDIGNIGEYRRAQIAVMDGHVKTGLDALEVKEGVWVGKGTSIDPRANLAGPCLIGDNCRIKKNATISRYTVIGPGSEIGQGASVFSSILWNGVKVGKHAVLDRCIIGMEESVPEKLTIFEGTIIDVHKLRRA